MNKIIVLLTFVILLFCWELSSHLSNNMTLVVPAPTKILWQMGESHDRFLLHSESTFLVMAGGFLLAALFAFPLAWFMSQKRAASAFFQPLFVVVQCIPMFVLAPILVLWFGWSYTAIVVPTAFMIFFPLTMSIYQGLRATPKDLLDYFRTHHATQWQTFYKLKLPWALPHIFSGFRISAAIAGIGAIAGEWAGAQQGLGVLMLESRRSADLEMMFGALFCLIMITALIYAAIAFVERLFLGRKFPNLMQRSMMILLFFIACGLTGCQQNSPETKSQATRLILDWFPNPNHVPLYVGLEKGIFAQHGINLQLIKTPDAYSPLSYLASGQAELAISYMPSLIRVQARGEKLKMIAILIHVPLNSIIYRKDAGISVPSDLNGKNIGYSVDGSKTKVLDYLLATNSIVPNQKLNVSFDLVSTLGTNQVDAIYGGFWNIECAQLNALGIKTDYFDLKQLGFPEYPELIILAKEGTKEALDGFKEQFDMALQESINFCLQNPDEAFEIYLNRNPDKGGKTKEWERAAWHKTYPLYPKNQDFNDNIITELSQWMENKQLL